MRLGLCGNICSMNNQYARVHPYSDFKYHTIQIMLDQYLIYHLFRKLIIAESF